MRYIFSHDGLNMGKSPNDLKKMSLKLVWIVYNGLNDWLNCVCIGDERNVSPLQISWYLY